MGVCVPLMIKDDLLRALQHAYELPELDAITQIHKGTHRVYRLDLKNKSGRRPIAVKVSKDYTANSLVGKQLEQSILQQLHKKLTFIPRLLTPNNEPEGTVCFSWGLLWNKDTIVTCYEWIPTNPYDGLKQQMKSAGYHFSLLENTFVQIDDIDTKLSTISLSQPCFRFEHNQLFLDNDFTFTIFQDFIESLPSVNTTISLLKNNLTYLQQETDELHTGIKHYSHDGCKLLQWVHLELSPSNFGFDPENKVNCIFDFDSLNRGLLLQDLGWLIATFCIDYRFTVTEAMNKISNILPVILSNLKLKDNWRDYLLTFMRMGYLDTIYRKILRYQNGDDTRLGFVKQDIHTLQWLRQHQTQLTRHIQNI